MAKVAATVTLIAALGGVLAGCSLAETGLPSEASALEELGVAEAVARDVVIDAVNPDWIGDWRRETIDDACAMSCRSCADTQSALGLAGEFSLDELMPAVARAAVDAGGSAGDVELFGETYVLYLVVNDDQADEHRIRVSLDGTTAEVSVATGCYRQP